MGRRRLGPRLGDGRWLDHRGLDVALAAAQGVDTLVALLEAEQRLGNRHTASVGESYGSIVPQLCRGDKCGHGPRWLA